MSRKLNLMLNNNNIYGLTYQWNINQRCKESFFIIDFVDEFNCFAIPD